jgi:sodium/proline symporter
MQGTFQTLIIFICYLAAMISIGMYFFKKAANLSDYFIGGRRLNPWVAAVSAHSADMSGWIFMGFPGAVYAFGTGRLWIAAGLALGTILSWVFVAKRLRRYTVAFNYSITIPEFFENRFRDDSHVLRISSAAFTFVFFAVYTASGFAACGTLFSLIFGINYQAALLIGVLVILTYTFLGGFRALCWIDFFHGLLMLAALITLPLIVLSLMGGPAALKSGPPPGFSPVFSGPPRRPLSPVPVISGLSWGIGYLGMPHILIRFMAVKSERAVSGAALVAGLCVLLSLGSAAALGLLGARFLPGLPVPETLFIEITQKIFMGNSPLIPLPVLGGLFLCGIFAAIISTADSQLLAGASTVTSDLYLGLGGKAGSEKSLLLVSRLSVVLISLMAYVIAALRVSGIMGLVSNAWSGFGSAFGALVLLSLYWKRLNRPGAAAGIIGGGLTVILWDYIPLIPSGGLLMTLGRFTGLYSLAPGFCVSLSAIVVVSLLSRAPSEETYREFAIAAAKPIYEE